jgi:hypothetical protein
LDVSEGMKWETTNHVQSWALAATAKRTATVEAAKRIVDDMEGD